MISKVIPSSCIVEESPAIGILQALFTHAKYLNDHKVTIYTK